MFGGQDEDNNKLNDVNFAMAEGGSAWIAAAGDEDDLKPVPRSGHSAVVAHDKMYVFGGILELTKELNDLAIFDFKTKKWCKADSDPFGEGGDCIHNEEEQKMQKTETSPLKKANTFVGSSTSPMKAGTMKSSTSPKKISCVMQPRDLSPPKRLRNADPSKREKAAKEDEGPTGLSSPTSISMKQSFIIANADDTFDSYYQ